MSDTIETLPKGFQLVLKVFSSSPVRTFKNIVTDQKVESRAFDWSSLKPILVGEERKYPQKEFVWSPTSGEVHFQLIFKKLGYEKIAEMLKSKTGVNFDMKDFKKELEHEIKRGSKRVMIITRAWQLCVQDCPKNEIIFWSGDSFTTDDCVTDEDPLSWNSRLEAKKSNWRLV